MDLEAALSDKNELRELVEAGLLSSSQGHLLLEVSVFSIHGASALPQVHDVVIADPQDAEAAGVVDAVRTVLGRRFGRGFEGRVGVRIRGQRIDREEPVPLGFWIRSVKIDWEH